MMRYVFIPRAKKDSSYGILNCPESNIEYFNASSNTKALEKTKEFDPAKRYDGGILYKEVLFKTKTPKK